MFLPVGPQLMCPTKLRVREGESLSCEARGNPPPSVTWFRDGEVVALPTNSSREHAGNYTVTAKSVLGQTRFTVEVEVLPGKGTCISASYVFICLKAIFTAPLFFYIEFLLTRFKRSFLPEYPSALLCFLNSFKTSCIKGIYLCLSS